MNESWSKYTLTAIFGILVGLVSTYTTMTVSNSASIEALRVRQDISEKQFERIEQKLDKLLLVKRCDPGH